MGSSDGGSHNELNGTSSVTIAGILAACDYFSFDRILFNILIGLATRVHTVSIRLYVKMATRLITQNDAQMDMIA